MLSYLQDGVMQLLDCDDYYIQQEWNGADNTLHISLPQGHPQMLSFYERLQICDTDTHQIYRVSKYDRTRSLELEAELDLDSLCAGVLLDWDNRADSAGNQWMTLGATVTAIVDGTGWTVDDQSARVDVQQMETFSGTLLEAITEAVSVWGNDLGVQYDNAQRIVHLYSPGQRLPTGAYLTTELNLLEAPQIRGKAARGEYYNRLYMIGADGLRLPSPYYVENRKPDEPIVSHVEVDEDITDTATLESAALSLVMSAASIPRSYSCKLADLYRLAPEQYKDLKLELYDTIIFIDREDYSRSYQEISRMRVYPLHPEKNEAVLASVPGTLSSTAARTYSVARDAASRAYNAKKAAKEAAKTATDYIYDSGSSVTVQRPSGGASVSMSGSGLTFDGVRNSTALWRNSNPSSMASGTRISLNLSSYAAIMIGFVDNLGGIFDSGVDGATTQYIIAPVNGVSQRATYTWDYPRVRTFTPTASGVTFGAGGYLESTTVGGIPVGANMRTNSACCVPSVIYGFM